MPAAQGRLAAQDESVSACRHDGFFQPQLREPPGANDTRGHVGRADVNLDGRRHRLELLKDGVEPIGDRVIAGRDEHVAAPQFAALDRGEVHRHALSGFRDLDRPVVYLDAPDADSPAGRLEPQEVASCDRARPERSGDDRADAAQSEGAVDPQPRRSEPFGTLDRLGRPP